MNVIKIFPSHTIESSTDKTTRVVFFIKFLFSKTKRGEYAEIYINEIILTDILKMYDLNP